MTDERDLAGDILRDARAKRRQQVMARAKESAVKRSYAEKRKHSAAGQSALKQSLCPGCGARMKLMSVPESGETHMICSGCSFVHTRKRVMDEGRQLGEKLPFGGRNRYKGRVTVRMRPDGKIEHVRSS